MADRTVILTTLNDAWAEPNSIFDYFLESFKTGNNTAPLLKHVLVICYDKKAYSRCLAALTHCYFFRSKQSAEMAHEAVFMSPAYVNMMWERLAFLEYILSIGYNFVFTDTDVMWLRDPFPHFLPDMDIQTSCDRFNGKPFDLNNFPNNGFSFVRSNSRTVRFYRYWINSRSRFPQLHDQDAFNKIKHEPPVKQMGLKIRFLDTDYFGGFCRPSKDFDKVCTMHANCCVGLDRKLVDLNITLLDWKRFMSERVAKWRVPRQCKLSWAKSRLLVSVSDSDLDEPDASS